VKNIFSQKGLVSLMEVDFPSPDKDLLESLIKMHRDLEKRIKESDGLVRDLYRELQEVQLINTVPGFGEFLSVLVATEIADIKRSESVEKLHSYAGVIPSTYSSGERTYHGKIIKAGNT
jgi:transposase